MSKNKKTVDIVCVLDRSGSMSGMANEVIGGFNKFIEDQKELKGKAKVTLVLFDNQYDVVYDRLKLKDVPELTEKTYFTRGMTALNDAIGKAIMEVSDKKDGIFLVQTDGMENASREFDSSMVKKLVKKMEDKGWDFVFIGAGIDAINEGATRGFAKTVQIKANDAFAQNAAYATLSTVSMNKRSYVAQNIVGGDVYANAAVDGAELNDTKKDSTVKPTA